VDPALKDPFGREALNDHNLVLRCIRQAKSSFPDLSLIADVALDPYTTHGHDGLLDHSGTRVANDETVEVLASMACLLAQAGADWVAPSDMMDGRVGAIRKALDARNFQNTAILSYCAKYASAFYGPFRDAVGSASAAGTAYLDKRGYQMNPANRREALTEAALDEEEGADALMVKPAGPYLDIIRELRGATQLPIAAYQVSGEYAQIVAAAQLGWLNREACAMESLTCIKRAGADLILSYFSESVAPLLPA
jgi:porphobilinogen synthase